MDTENKIAERATAAFVEELKANPTVQSVILFGSQARGNARPGSDVDLIIVCDATKRGVEEREGQVFELVYVTEADALSFYEANKDNAVRTWETARILFEKDGSATRLQAAAALIRTEGKVPLAGDKLLHAKFDTEDFVRAVRSKAETDTAEALFLMYAKVPNVLDTYFDIHGWWTPAPKQMLSKLKEQDPELYRRVHSLYSDSGTTAERLDLFERVVARVFS